MNKKRLRLQRRTLPWLLILPHLGGVVLFYVYPFLWSLQYSFRSRNGFSLDVYRDLVQNDAFRLAMRNTAFFTGLAVPLLLLVSFAVAMALHLVLKGSRLILHLFILYYAVPSISIAYTWTLLFANSGLFNRGAAFVMGVAPLNWLDGSWLFVPLVSFFLVKYSAYPILILFAGLGAIPGELYEEAEMGGATFWQKTRYLTLPLLAPELGFAAVLGFYFSLRVYKDAYAMFGAYPPKSVYLLQHFMNNNFISLHLERLTAASSLTAVFVALVILFFFQRNRSAYFPQTEK